MTNPAPDDNDPLIPDMSNAKNEGTGVVLSCETDENLVLLADLRNSDFIKKAGSNFLFRFITGRHDDTVKGSSLVRFVEETRKVCRTGFFSLKPINPTRDYSIIHLRIQL